VSHDESLRGKMILMTNGARSDRQIFVDNSHIGDCEKIYKLDKENKLDYLLSIQ
jgi:glutaredoxin 3